METEHKISDESVDAVKQATKAALAVEEARNKQILDALKESDERTTKVVSDALRDVFGEHQSTGRFIDVARIPLICKSILDINGSMKEIKDMFTTVDKRYVNQDQFVLVKNIVYGLCGTILLGFIGTLLTLVFKR